MDTKQIRQRMKEAAGLAPAFPIGARVRVKRSAFVTPRTDRIADIGVNSCGTTIYFLQDGGRFSADELELRR